MIDKPTVDDIMALVDAYVERWAFDGTRSTSTHEAKQAIRDALDALTQPEPRPEPFRIRADELRPGDVVDAPEGLDDEIEYVENPYRWDDRAVVAYFTSGRSDWWYRDSLVTVIRRAQPTNEPTTPDGA